MSSGSRKVVKDNIKKIDKYWKQVAKDNPKYLIELVGEDCFLNIIDEDYKEKICYACGKDCNPQRAHIIPDSLGGEPNPDNMFLLCVSCHQNNPDTIYKDMFFKYIKSVTSHLNTRFELLHHYIQNLIDTSTKEDVDKFMQAISIPKQDIVEKFLYVDINEHSVGLSNALSEATVISVLWKRAIESQSI